MSGIPMLCRFCGLSFQMPNLITVAGPTVVHMSNISAPCPRCGRPASEAESGTYLAEADGTWNLLLGALTQSRLTRDDFERLLEVLRWARATPQPAEAVQGSIVEAVPDLAAVGDFLASKQGLALATWIGVLVAIVSLLVALHGGPGATTINNNVTINEGFTPTQLEQVMAGLLEEADRRHAATDPCPCGSGRLVSACHGR